MNLCDTAIDFVDKAESLEDISAIIQSIPLSFIKESLKSRITHIKNKLQHFSNPQNNANCSSEYNEIKRLSMSVAPITDILPKDVMIHTLGFVIGSCDRKRPSKYLPVVSKAFKSITDDLYSKKCPIFLYEQNLPIQTTPDSSTLHISVIHDPNGSSRLRQKYIEIKHMEPRLPKSTTYIKKIPQLRPSNLFESSLPWKQACKLIINGDSAHGRRMNNENNLKVLKAMTNIKYLTLQNLIPVRRLVSYPTFQNLVCLSLRSFIFQIYSFQDELCWLNKDRFPSLKILDINSGGWIHSIISSIEHLNSTLATLNLSALCIREWSDLIYPSTLKIPSTVQFLVIGSKISAGQRVAGKLDLSECTNLIGIKFYANVSFSEIIFSHHRKLAFINVANHINDESWRVAYKKNLIPSDILVGNVFFEPTVNCGWSAVVEPEYFKEPFQISKKANENFIRRRSMTFRQLEAYINSSNDYSMPIDWASIYKKHFAMNEAAFIESIGHNSVFTC